MASTEKSSYHAKGAKKSAFIPTAAEDKSPLSSRLSRTPSIGDSAQSARRKFCHVRAVAKSKSRFIGRSLEIRPFHTMESGVAASDVTSTGLKNPVSGPDKNPAPRRIREKFILAAKSISFQHFKYGGHMPLHCEDREEMFRVDGTEGTSPSPGLEADDQRTRVLDSEETVLDPEVDDTSVMVTVETVDAIDCFTSYGCGESTMTGGVSSPQCPARSTLDQREKNLSEENFVSASTFQTSLDCSEREENLPEENFVPVSTFLAVFDCSAVEEGNGPQVQWDNIEERKSFDIEPKVVAGEASGTISDITDEKKVSTSDDDDQTTDDKAAGTMNATKKEPQIGLKIEELQTSSDEHNPFDWLCGGICFFANTTENERNALSTNMETSPKLETNQIDQKISTENGNFLSLDNPVGEVIPVKNNRIEKENIQRKVINGFSEVKKTVKKSDDISKKAAIKDRSIQIDEDPADEDSTDENTDEDLTDEETDDEPTDEKILTKDGEVIGEDPADENSTDEKIDEDRTDEERDEDPIDDENLRKDGKLDGKDVTHINMVDDNSPTEDGSALIDDCPSDEDSLTEYESSTTNGELSSGSELTDEEIDKEAPTDGTLEQPTLLKRVQSNLSRASSRLSTKVKEVSEDVGDLAWHMVAGGEDNVFVEMASEAFRSSNKEGETQVIIDFEPFDFDTHDGKQ